MEGLATGRMGIGVIGDEPSGVIIARALGAAGHAVIARSEPREDRQDMVEVHLGSVPIVDQAVAVARSELVILALSPDRLVDTVAELGVLGAWQAGQVVVHLSAEHGLEVLRPAISKGAIGIRLFPLMAFTGTSLDLSNLKESWCMVSAPGPVLPIAQALAIEIGAEPTVLDDRFHEEFAAGIAEATRVAEQSVRSAVGLLRSAGLESPEQAAASLLRSSVERALTERSGE